MTSKTFKSAISDRELDVRRTSGGLVGLYFGKSNIHLDPSDAPAQALAVLEAAGYKASPNGPFNVAACYLRQGINEQERATAEAKEQAELEAEALELYNVCMTGHNLTSFDGLGGALRDQWLAVARRAREMRAEK